MIEDIIPEDPEYIMHPSCPGIRNDNCKDCKLDCDISSKTKLQQDEYWEQMERDL